MADYPNARDCEHGSMRGKCETCEHLEDLEELEKVKSLLGALWKNRKDDHWCFEMSSTIEDVIFK